MSFNVDDYIQKNTNKVKPTTPKTSKTDKSFSVEDYIKKNSSTEISPQTPPPEPLRLPQYTSPGEEAFEIPHDALYLKRKQKAKQDFADTSEDLIKSPIHLFKSVATAPGWFAQLGKEHVEIDQVQTEGLQKIADLILGGASEKEIARREVAKIRNEQFAQQLQNFTESNIRTVYGNRFLNPESKTEVGKYVADLMTGAGTTLMMLAATYISKSPAAGLSLMYMTERGMNYEQARRAGLTPQQASVFTQAKTGVNIAIETVGFNYLIRIKGGFLWRAFKAALSEGFGEELLQGITDRGFDTVYLEKAKLTMPKIMSIVEEAFKNDAVKGAIIGGTIGGATSIATHKSIKEILMNEGVGEKAASELADIAIDEGKKNFNKAVNETAEQMLQDEISKIEGQDTTVLEEATSTFTPKWQTISYLLSQTKSVDMVVEDLIKAFPKLAKFNIGEKGKNPLYQAVGNAVLQIHSAIAVKNITSEKRQKKIKKGLAQFVKQLRLGVNYPEFGNEVPPALEADLKDFVKDVRGKAKVEVSQQIEPGRSIDEIEVEMINQVRESRKTHETYEKTDIPILRDSQRGQLTRMAEAAYTAHYGQLRLQAITFILDGYKEGKNFQAINESIRKAGINTRLDAAQTDEMFENLLQGLNITKEDLITGKQTIEGLEITQEEKIGIYIYSLNELGKQHLIYGNKVGKMLETIKNTMTKEEMAIVKFILTRYNEQYKVVDKVYFAKTGEHLTKVDFYASLHVQKDYLSVEQEIEGGIIGMYKKAGIKSAFAKGRNQEAAQPLKLNIIHNFINDMSLMAFYKNHGILQLDLNKLVKNDLYKQEIVNNIPGGEQLYKNLVGNIDSVFDNKYMYPQSDIERILRGLRVNATVAVLGFKVATSLKQIASLEKAAAICGNGHIAAAINEFRKDPKGFIKFVKENSDIVRNRNMERDIQELERMVAEGRLGYIRKRLSLAAMSWVRFTDRYTVAVSWKGLYDYAKQAEGMNHEEAVDFAEHWVSRTQPMARPEDLPMFFKGGEISKMITVFKNQLNQNYNFWSVYVAGARIKGKISNKQLIQRVWAGWILSGFMLMGAGTGFSYWKDPKRAALMIATMPLQSPLILGTIMHGIIMGYGAGSPMSLQFQEDLSAGTFKKAIMGIEKLTGTPEMIRKTAESTYEFITGEDMRLRRLLGWTKAQLGDKNKKEPESEDYSW